MSKTQHFLLILSLFTATTTSAFTIAPSARPSFLRLSNSPDDSSSESSSTESAGAAAEELSSLPDESQSNILSSPAFLKRKLEILKKDIEDIDKEIDEAKGQLVDGKLEWGFKFDQLQKEYVNIKERTLKQNEESGGKATIDVVRKLLDVLDNFDRAFGAVTPTTDSEKDIEAAYKRVYQDVHDTFRSLGITEVETVGKEFDYEVHSAVMTKPSEEYEEGVVFEEMAKGYMLGEELIRPAMVCVAA